MSLDGITHMIDDAPLVRPADRFPIGLAGHTVPLSAATPTPGRPWGMDHAVVPALVTLPQMGKHEKPTRTYNKSDPTEYTLDSKIKTDTKTVTVTD